MAVQNAYLGSAYLSLGEYQTAIHYYKKALEINTAIGDQLGMTSERLNLGKTYFAAEEYKDASV